MTAPLRRKRGETLRLTLLHEIDDVAVDLTGYTITSFARIASDTTDGTPLAEADCAALNQATLTGRFTVDFGSTAAWLVGRVLIDVKLDSGDIVITPTITVDIEKAVTS